VVLCCAGVVLTGYVYRLGRGALGLSSAVARSDRALFAGVLVLRQENAALRRKVARVRYEPADRAWFAAGFDAVFEDCGRRGPRTWTNAICERLVVTLRREVLDRLLILNEAHLRAVLAAYAAHYNAARPHQGIGQRVPDDDPDHPVARVIDLDSARIRREQVLGRIMVEYQVIA
jgi:putative transposase